MTALSFGFTKIVVADLARAEEFYTQVFGLKPMHRVTAEDHAYPLEEIILSLSPEGHKLLLVRYLTRPCPPAGAAWIGFTVADMATALNAVEASGGRIEVPPHDNSEHGVIAAIAADPDGHLIEVIQSMAST
jgi:catechol 2,3-dioxygenase-like lactoylglutathione lyase family enzyme